MAGTQGGVSIYTGGPAGGIRFGRIFRLRDKGRLEEALREALSLADDRLDRPEVAYDVLTRAVAVIEQLRAELVPRLPRKPGDFESLVESYHRLFRDRLYLIVSRRNS